MIKQKYILSHPKVVMIIGLDAHIMLLQIKRWLKIKSPCGISHKKWKEIFPLWTFSMYLKTKKYLIKNKFIISQYGYASDKVYTINYKKLRDLIQEK